MMRYLNVRGRVLMLLVACGIMFVISFILYQLPIKAVLYPMGLCLLLIVIWVAFDYKKCKHRWKLEEERDIEEQELRDRIVELEHGYDDMMDYYTVWVHQIKTPIAAMNLTLQNEDSSLSRRLMSELFRVE